MKAKAIENEEKVSEEAYAYTPGLKVKRAMTITKTRRLPIPGEVFVEKGKKVNYYDIVARTEIPGDPEIVKVALLLGVEPEDLPRYMTKKVGDKVAKDEVIAAYNALFGLIKKRVPSPIDGTIESISDVTGQVIVRGLPVPVEVDAYIPGEIVEVLPREGAVIETNAAFIQGIFGVGGETHGEIRMAVGSPDEVLSPDQIKAGDKGKVLVGGSMVTLEALRKAVDVGVSCIVVGGVRHKDVTTFMGEEIGVAITGHEEVGLTLIVTEGFGEMKMSRRTFDLLKSFEGYLAAVNGATQIRAGVMRPEIIIPHSEFFEQSTSEELSAGMVPGTPVRIIRQPYFGAIGKVVSLPIELQKVQTESYVRVLEVELEDGRVVTVPRANVEIIEE
jgi:transcription antitermination factor NusG